MFIIPETGMDALIVCFPSQRFRQSKEQVEQAEHKKGNAIGCIQVNSMKKK